MELCKQLTVYVYLNNLSQAKNKIEQLEELGVPVVGLPEQYGTQACVDLVANSIKSNNTLSVVTMFPQTVNFVGDLVYNKLVNRENATVVLTDGVQTSKHYFDEEGCLTDGWPFGCMEPNHTDAIHELKLTQQANIHQKSDDYTP